MAERLPPGVYDADNTRLPYVPNGLEPNGVLISANGDRHSRSDSLTSSYPASQMSMDSVSLNGTLGTAELPRDSSGSYETSQYNHVQGPLTPYGRDNRSDVRLPYGNGDAQARNSGASETADTRESGSVLESENGSKSRSPAAPGNSNQVEAEWIEQYEPGVYITLVALRDGTRDLKRVRFRYLCSSLCLRSFAIMFMIFVLAI